MGSLRESLSNVIQRRFSSNEEAPISDEPDHATAMSRTGSRERDLTTRSLQMSRVRTADTALEQVVEQQLRLLGYRWISNDPGLPGKPDFSFPKLRKVVFVHGCFWHGHECPRGRLPKSNTEFWIEKIARNSARDRRQVEALELAGWDVLIIWGCALRPARIIELACQLLDFLEAQQPFRGLDPRDQ